VTGLVDDEIVLDSKGELVSEARFKMHSERQFINMDETITGDKGGLRAVSYYNPAYQRGAARGVKSARHVTGAYATNAAGEALPPFYIHDSSAKTDANYWVQQSPEDTAAQLVSTLTTSSLFGPADQWMTRC
jgi:hypothetical protein